MTDIKPVAVATAAVDPVYQGTVKWIRCLQPIPMNTNLYPESALAQAREEGRREGMREAADICEKVLGKRERNPYIDRSAYESACDDCMDEITRAAEGK